MTKVKIKVWCLSTDDGSKTYAMNRYDLPFGGFLVQGATTETCEQLEVEVQSNEHSSAVHNSRRLAGGCTK